MREIKENIALIIFITLVLTSPLAFMVPLILPMQNTYTTRLENKLGDIWFQLGRVDEMNHSESIIKWQLQIDAREYGIKSINITIDSIQISYNEVVYVEDDDDTETYITQPIIDGVDGWEIVNEGKGNCDGIYPTGIEVDWDNKRVTVKFE